MLFNSLSFLVFLPVVVAGYYLLPERARWAWLLAASCYFYAAFVPAYLLVLGALVLADYVLGILIFRASDDRARKRLLALGVAFNLGLLFSFKYLNFANENIGALANALGWNYSVDALSFLLPLGLSFHVFQALSYLIEISRGKQEPERHLGIFALFVMFFPQLVAGPIERASHLLPQFRGRHAFLLRNLGAGAGLIIVGFFMKIAVADRAALVADVAFQDPSALSGPSLLLALVLFAFQLYGDFAGYSLIALGSARMLGFSLIENFRRPYLARSVGEFWQRWHISLSTWLRDYVYQGVIRLHRRVSLRALYTAVFVTFLASGVWHGAGWNFVLMGAWFGGVIVLELATRNWRDAFPKIPVLSPLGATFGTFALVLVGWVFFRSPSLAVAFDYLSGVFRAWDAPWSSFGYPPAELLVTLALCGALMSGELFLERLPRLAERMRSSWFFRSCFYATLVLLTLAFGEFHAKVFIYFQF